MVGRASRKRPEVSLSHQRCWLWGRHAVLETLSAGRWPILELRISDDLPEAERQQVHLLARQRGVIVQYDARSALSKHCPREDHQGYLARMPPFPYAELSSVLDLKPTLILVLDGIQDPYNFGAILRSAEVFGAAAVCIGLDHQAEVSSHVARSSAGAVNRVSIVRADLLDLASQLQTAGLVLIGASEKATKSIHECDFRSPVAIVIGNEGHGIREELLTRCHDLVRIPQSGKINSLNAAAATAVICYEVGRQR